MSLFSPGRRRCVAERLLLVVDFVFPVAEQAAIAVIATVAVTHITQARSTHVLSRRPRTARRVCVQQARGGRLSPSCLRARACQCPKAHAVLAAFRRSRRWSGALSGLYTYPACRQAQGVHPLRSPPPSALRPPFLKPHVRCMMYDRTDCALPLACGGTPHSPRAIIGMKRGV